MSLISVKNLVKEYKTYDRREGLSGAFLALVYREYKTLKAVNDISFDIEKGEMVGYIGANGAGKSTTIKMLCGVLYPTSGSIVIDGRVPVKNREAHVRNIGAVFGQRSQLWWDLAAGESLRLLGRIYGVEKKDFDARMAEFETVLKLKDFLKTPARKLSLGQKMRCELAASLIHNPKIVFLDEPTIGLDVAVKQSIREFVKMINRDRGVTVILTTHDLRDIEELCSRVFIIDKGKQVFDGTLDALKERSPDSGQLTFTLKHELKQHWKPDGLPLKGVTWKAEGPALTAILAREAPPRAEVIRAALDMFGADVEDIQIAEPGIERIVTGIYAEHE